MDCVSNFILAFCDTAQSVGWCEEGCEAYEQEIFPDGSGKCRILTCPVCYTAVYYGS